MFLQFPVNSEVADSETISQEFEVLYMKVNKLWLKTTRCQKKSERLKSSKLSLLEFGLPA